MFPQQAAVHDIANHIVVVQLVHAQLDQAIGEQNVRTLFDILRQRLEGGAHHRSRALDLPRRDGKPVTRHQLHGQAALESAGANLWSLQIAQDAQRLALLPAHVADHPHHRQLPLVRAMGKVQAHHIHAGAHHVPDHRLRVRGWPKCGDDFRAALNRGIGQDHFSKRHGKTP